MSFISALVQRRPTKRVDRERNLLLHAMVAKIDFSATDAKIRRKEPTPSLTKFSVVAI